MRPIEQKIMKVAESVTGAVTEASDTCFSIVAGQVAGVGAHWIDKLFLTDEDREQLKKKKNGEGEKRAPRVRSLDRKRAEKMAETLSKSVSTPPEII